MAVVLPAVLFAGVAATLAEEMIWISTDSTSVTVHAGGKSEGPSSYPSTLPDDKPILRYRYAEVPFKPYVQEFYTPGGVQVLRDSPHDHKHHHALMFAVAVDGLNFWEERDAFGQQAHQRLDDFRVGKQDDVQRAAFTERIDWINPSDKNLLIQEARTIEVYQGKDMGASLMTWQSRFTLPPGKASATLTGSAYFGLGARFLQSMDTGGRFLNADGKTGVEGTNNVRSAWCSYAAKADGKPVTVAVFDHPGNERHPATWFTMTDAFAYLSATMNLHGQSFAVTADKPLVLRYGVAVIDGTAEAAAIEKLHRRWIALTAREASPAPGK